MKKGASILVLFCDKHPMKVRMKRLYITRASSLTRFDPIGRICPSCRSIVWDDELDTSSKGATGNMSLVTFTKELIAEEKNGGILIGAAILPREKWCGHREFTLHFDEASPWDSYVCKTCGVNYCRELMRGFLVTYDEAERYRQLFNERARKLRSPLSSLYKIASDEELWKRVGVLSSSNRGSAGE